MLAVAGRLPEGDQWCYELKWDGVRALAYVEGGRTRLVSRSGNDLSDRYAELVEGPPIGPSSALVDGELVALDRAGRPSFQMLQTRLRDLRAGRPPAPLAYLAFDLLHVGSRSLLRQPYDDRRSALSEMALVNPRWSVPGSFGPPGADVLEASRAQGLEGVVAKRRTSTYLPGRRSDAWIKVKNFRTQEVVIGGWTEGEGRRSSSFGSLLCGIPAGSPAGPLGEALLYCGNVGTGFDEAALADLLAALRPLERASSPFAGRLPPIRARRARFVEPRLVGEVRFAEWTDDGRLRQASWRGLRDDKSPREVVREP